METFAVVGYFFYNAKDGFYGLSSEFINQFPFFTTEFVPHLEQGFVGDVFLSLGCSWAVVAAAFVVSVLSMDAEVDFAGGLVL